VDPRTVWQGANGHDRVVELENESRELRSAIAAIAADLDTNGESPVL
jgi:hypothetical protein